MSTNNANPHKGSHHRKSAPALGRFSRCAALISGAIFGIGVVAVPMAAPAGASTSVINVVAAENFWGSIAAQIGGSHVHVQSIITNPNTDPHAYEPTPSDARSIAEAQLVIVNGVGYDPWAPKLIAADASNQKVVNVGSLLGLKDGDNPHRWYNPKNVQQVITSLTNNFKKLDPTDSSYFTAKAKAFTTTSLKTYDNLVAEIKAKYAGTKVGASESIFAMLSPSLGLNLITPPTFLRAISEGTEVSAADKATIDNQIHRHLIKIYVYNSQNATPDIAAQLVECKKENIPTATITETLSPENDTYQAWQVRQLRGILAALQKANGK